MSFPLSAPVIPAKAGIHSTANAIRRAQPTANN